jgi:hypothetical protein
MYAKFQYFWRHKFLKGSNRVCGHAMCENDFQLILDKVLINSGLRFTTKVTKDF